MSSEPLPSRFSKAIDVMVSAPFMLALLVLGWLWVQVFFVSLGILSSALMEVIGLVSLVVWCPLFVTSVLALLVRTYSRIRQGEPKSTVLISGSWLLMYGLILLLCFYFIELDSLSRLQKDFVWIAVGGAFLFLVHRSGHVEWAFVLAGAVLRHFLGEPQVYRPDVLKRSANLRSVEALLPLRQHAVFCGEMVRGRTATPLYTGVEDRGVVIGPPGTGKTGFMVTQLLDLAERRGSFVCLDIKPELHTIMREKLKEKGYRVLVFNPSKKADRYNLLDDMTGPTAIGELAYSLISSTSDEGRVFDEGARDLLDGIISYLRVEKKPVSLPALRQFIAQFPTDTALVETLSRCKDPDVRDTAFAIARSAKNARFMGSVFATLRSNLRFLRYEDIRSSIERSDFSLSVFSGDQPVALFLQFEERHQDTTSLLLSATISHLFTYFIEHTDRAPVMLMLDEIGNVPRIPGLVEKLNTIRSRQLPTWLYWQGVHQMHKYGNSPGEGANQILGACDFQMVFRLNDNDSARWFSDRIGTVDREVISTSSTGGENGGSSSTSYSVTEEPIMKIADLQNLPTGESIAVYRGKAWRNRATPYFVRWPEMARKPSREGRLEPA